MAYNSDILSAFACRKSLGTCFVISDGVKNNIINDKNKKRYNYGKSNWN